MRPSPRNEEDCVSHIGGSHLVAMEDTLIEKFQMSLKDDKEGVKAQIISLIEEAMKYIVHE